MEKTNIFNLNVAYGNYDDFLKKFLNQAVNNKSQYHVFTNSHMIYEVHHSAEYMDVVAGADTICPDGMPLTYSVRWIKKKKTDRIAGNDMIFSLVEAANKNKLKVFFYGSSDQVLNKIKEKIDKDYYGSLEAMYYSPPFRALSEEEYAEHAGMINDFGANLVFVGLGCPKQERWMHKMKNIVKAPMFGVGGAFLLYGGIDSRAPKLMRDLGIEWVYRLALEPRRLFLRYFVTNVYFCRLVVKEILKKRR